MEASQIRVTFPSDAPQTTAQYRFGKVTSGSKIAVVSSLADNPVGVIDDNVADSNREVQVVVFGKVDVIFGGSITAGGEVTFDANGAAIAVDTGGGKVRGIACETGVTGDIKTILLIPLGI